MNQRTKRRILLVGLVAILGAAASPSHAGLKEPVPLLITRYNNNLWTATAVFASVRYSISAVEVASCSIDWQDAGGPVDFRPYGSCTFTDSAGTKTCITDKPSLVKAIQAIKGDSRITVKAMKTGGTGCTEITVTQGSQYEPKTK